MISFFFCGIINNIKRGYSKYEENAIFSIIIPAYNAQDYIENCIKSILEQNFQNYEIIIIDDGSTDDTLKIIASYAQACDNIIFSHKENGGIGTAIPIGIELASGQYIVFVDSDDTVKKACSMIYII